MISRLVDRRLKFDDQDLVVQQLGLLGDLVAPLGHPQWAFDLVLVEDEAMTELNGQYRDKDGVTDVLSFSYLLQEGAGPCDLKAAEGGAFHDLWIDPFSQAGLEENLQQIGEIILAPSFVKHRCQQRGWPLVEELPLLVVHGSLHLLGWDHQNEKETRAMRELEQKYLTACGLTHPLLPEERVGG